MIISQIVAVAKNGAIGKNNDLPWRLPADLKFFKNTTLGHHLISGRKNYESIGRPLPGRTTFVLSKNTDYKADGCKVFSKITTAINTAKESGEKELFIMGGAQIYKDSLPFTHRIYLTEVDTTVEDADTFYPELDLKDWNEISRSNHLADEKNPFNYSFVLLERK